MNSTVDCSTPCSGDICIANSEWNLTSDLSHVTGGCLFIVAPVIILSHYVRPQITAAVASILWLVFVFVKELWYDPLYQSPQEAGSSAVDIATYLAGWIAGLLLVSINELAKATKYSQLN